MDSRSQERIARNEALLRDANEAIEKGIWPDERRHLIPFRCECSRLECNQALEVTPEEYELVRANPRRFMLVDGHEVPGGEVVVERHSRYTVVEKQGRGAETAERLDPRG